jgi:predicted PurR-regulated permease PerM
MAKTTHVGDVEKREIHADQRRKAIVEEIGPTETYDPIIKSELKRALVWISTAVAFIGVWYLAQPLLLIFGGIVIAAMLDGGTRLVRRFLPFLPRGVVLTFVTIGVFAFFVWTFILTGNELASQAAALQKTIEFQIDRISIWATQMGLTATNEDLKSIGQQILGSVGQVTAAVSNVVGSLANVFMMLVLGIFIAAEPRMYERGVAWMLPMSERAYFYGTMARMASAMRRLMAGRLVGMAVEGIGTWALLSLAGVPMAALLGVLTGILAFLPNIGAIISGGLIIIVGFSAGVETGLLAIAIYVIVQAVDGYLIVPMVAKKAVDLAPALVLGAQILFGAMFGIMGLALADPIVAMLKVALERRSEKMEARAAMRQSRELPAMAGQRA